MGTPRQDALVRAAHARAQVTACLEKNGVATPDHIYPVIDKALAYTMPQLMSLLDRMVDGGLLEKVAVEHPDYKKGYRVALGAGSSAPQEHKPRQKKVTEVADVDIKVNKRTGGLTITYAGLRLTISKEE